MKSIVQFFQKEETTGDDLVIILIGCVAFVMISILVLMGTGN